jgi:hypothetical protein
MWVSELIAELAELIGEHGDTEVYLGDMVPLTSEAVESCKAVDQGKYGKRFLHISDF